MDLIDKEEISYSERIEAQYNFITRYRRLKIKKLNPGPEKFRLLLSRMRGKDGAKHLLTGVGWFALATAFKTGKPVKQEDREKILSLFADVPEGAGYLILDVLDGTVNPNIIQDEIQINRARDLCVREIAALYEDGLIDLF